MGNPTVLTVTQRNLQSDEEIGPKSAVGPTVQLYSVGTTVTDLSTVTASTIYTSDSQSVTSGTTADPNATYIGKIAGTAMFAIKNPNGPVPPVLNDPLAAPPIPGGTGYGFNDKGTIKQGTLGNL
jgi:hypothetical protein